MRSPRLLLFFALLFPAVSHAAEYRLADQPAEEELSGSTGTATAFPGASFLRFSPALWNDARQALEEGREPGAEPDVDVSTETLPVPTEEPGGMLNVELPYESGLSIAGRKLISVKVQQTTRKSEARARELGLSSKTQTDFEMHQELQVKIKGKVGRKIAVNVDFDDTKDDKRDISVVYTGDPDEVVQEAAFGDIVLSLPSTEFVSYSKQLFGVRTKLKYKNAQLMAIGSRTKGVTETKRFNGDVRSERREILDTSYIRRRYYNLDFTDVTGPPARAIRPGSVTLWRDDRNPATTPDVSFTAEIFGSTVTHAGEFIIMKEGEDYALDLSRGLVIFTREVALDAVIAVDYQFEDDGQLLSAHPLGGGNRKLLQLSGDTFTREFKTFYSIGQAKIVPDNGRGNFLFKTQDLNRLDNAVFLNNGDQLRYPDNVDVDPTNGLFHIDPLTVQVDTTTHKLYDPTPEHKFSFVVEYRFKVRSYIIKPNIVLDSERVSLNGRLLARDVDYFLDYDSGFLTFFNEDQIDETSQIEVTYEFSPFGGQLGETLVGARTELDLVPGRFKAGSTLLYNFAPKPVLVPDVRATPRSLVVLEADAQLRDWQLPFTPATLSISGEVAQSKENPNLFGRALVDSMEGAKQEVMTVMGPEAWRPASNPGQGTFPPILGAASPGRPDTLWTSLSDEQVTLQAINPFISPERADDKVRLLRLPFSMDREPGTLAGETVSIVQSISKAGLDFSKKLTMEMWIMGASTGATSTAGRDVNLCVNVGQFNEDADRDGQLDTEDANEDGGLNFGEDIGWTFENPGTNGLKFGPVTVGPGNNRMDSEDLDGDGALRQQDATPRGTQPLFCLESVSGSAQALDQDVRMIDPNLGIDVKETDLNFQGWRLVTVPLDISPSEEAAFQAIKQVRLTLINNDTGAQSGPFLAARLSFVGTSWEKPTILPAVGGGTMTLSAINNVDNPGYTPLLGNEAYGELYGDEADNRTREQALSLRFSLPAASTATTRQVFQSPRDFSNHRNLQFFLRIASATAPTPAVFSLQLGSEADYYEYTVPLDSRYTNTWVLESLQLTDQNDDDIPDVLTPAHGSVRVVGSPSFQRIGQMKLVIQSSGAAVASEVWVNEIHVTGSRKREGHAQRVAADFVWPGWGGFGGSLREVDRHFQTLTAQVLNQDRQESAANANFSRLRWLPLSGNVTKSKTITPAVFRTGAADLVSLLSEGEETTVTGRGDGQLLIPGLPAIGFSYDKSLAKSTSRGEKRDRDAYTGSADYQMPWAPDVLPGGFWAFRPLPQSVFVKYIRTNSFLSVISSTAIGGNRELAFNRAAVVELADEWSGRMPFAPWNGLSLQPGATWRKVRERRRFSEEALALAPDFSPAGAYQKAMSQNFTLSGAWRIARWLEPRFDGDLSGTENNVLPSASSPTAFNVKLIERTARGNLFWTFRAVDLAPDFKPTRSLRLETSYRLESGDAYENVPKDDFDWRKMRPFDFKRINRKGGRRMYGLLEPLDMAGTSGRRKQLTARNSLRSSLDWTPFDWLTLQGAAEPLRTFRMTVTMTNTDEHAETGEATRDVSTVVWPDVLFSIRDTERFLRMERWMRNSQLNLRANRKDTETFEEDFRQDNSMGSDYHFLLKEKYDVFAAYGVTDGFSLSRRTGLTTSESQGYAHSLQVGTQLFGWQVTPRADFRGDKSVDSSGRATQDTTFQTYSVLLRLDKAYPRGFRIPFTKKVYENVNRLIVDGKVGFERKESGIDVDRNNTDTYTTDFTGEWEISRHFRLSFGGGISLVENRVRKEDGVMSFNLTSQLVINF